MRKKLTIEFVRESFEKEGYTLLTKKYTGCNQKLDYICPQGDYGTITWSNWQQGNRCAECAGLKKLTIEFIREQFEREGYTLESEVYIDNKTSLHYTCPEGHPGTISWSDWKQGCRCKTCSIKSRADKLRHTIEFVREQFEREGYTLLTKEYISNKQLLEYICPRGDVGVIKWNNWQQGQRCPACNGNKKLTITFVREQFKKEKYILLTKKYINARQKLDYICPIGHVWKITWDKWQQGKRCGRCRYKGSNNPNYNPNLTDEDRVHRRDYLEYAVWCLAVKKKSDFTCTVCGNIGGNLVSHHLESYNNNPDFVAIHILEKVYTKHHNIST